MNEFLLIIVFSISLVAYLILFRRLRSRRIGSAAIGSFYDMLERDKRKAVETLVEQKAEEQDPETADGPPRVR